MADQLDFELKLGSAVKIFATQADSAFDASLVAASALRARNTRWPAVDLRRIALAIGAVALVVVTAAFAANFLANRSGLVGPAATATPAPSPVETSSAPPTPGATATPRTSGGMWPQSTIEDVRQAQELADAGDPDYTWQVDPLISEDISHAFDPNSTVFLSRFLRDKLGWEKAVFNPFVGWDELYENLVFVRCAVSGNNALYANDERAGDCAPTIDDGRYETVRLSLGQPVREGLDGVWVVTQWQMDPPFAQADPRLVEADASERLEEFLRARVAGTGAEGYVDFGGQAHVFAGTDVVPLMYATSAGAAYERYEIDVTDGPHWPFGDLEFEVRLFADGGETIVEQPFTWRDGGLVHDRTETVENGELLAVAFHFFDGEVTLHAAKPWHTGFERNSLDLSSSGGAIVLMSDPQALVSSCGSGAMAANARALANMVASDPDLLVSSPAMTSVGEFEALSMDVTRALGASCDGVLDDGQRGGAAVGEGVRMRLYLFDMPDGSTMGILAIAVVAPEEEFATVMDAAMPILDSIEFKAGRDE